ncbi:MAG: hypothetical protein H7315_02685 [Herminiimonas sp.]|nr:hypothetical protein [Herminiimonas sp.]
MSFLSTAFPFQLAMPLVHTVAGDVSALLPTLLGLGLFLALSVVFKPLLVGLLRAALLVLQPRLSLEERGARRTLRGVVLLTRMARDLDCSQPGLAAEMRVLAGRG